MNIFNPICMVLKRVCVCVCMVLINLSFKIHAVCWLSLLLTKSAIIPYSQSQRVAADW